MVVDFIGWIVALLAIVAGTVYYYYYFFGGGGAERSSPPTSKRSKHKDTPCSSIPKEEEDQQTLSSNKSRQRAANNNKNKKKTSQNKSTVVRQILPTHERFVRRFGGHSGTITCMAVSPKNGEWIATAGVDGFIRVAQTTTAKGGAFAWHVQTKVQNSDAISRTGGVGSILFQDYISALSWHGDDRTLTCVLHHARQVAFYRVRKKIKTDATAAVAATPSSSSSSSSNDAYELVELVKRRFSTQSKDMNTIDTCVTDTAHGDSFCLVLTSSRLMSSHNAVAWDGMTGQAVGTLTITPSGSSRICLSPDGRFICGTGDGSSSSSSRAGGVAQVKIFEVQRKKIKDQVEPMFDKISSKSVMTIVVTKGCNIVDVAFMGMSRLGGGGTETMMTTPCDKAVVGCVDGSLQVWSLDVEFHLQEDPKLLCSTMPDLLQGKSIVAVAAGHYDNRIAVVTEDDTLHVLTFHPSSASTSKSSSTSASPSISLDCSIPNVQYIDSSGSSAIGSSAIQFCPKTSRLVYTKSSNSKDIFCWNVA